MPETPLPPTNFDQTGFAKMYAENHAPWDSGLPCEHLIQAIESGNFGKPGNRVLELGCGTGTNAVELARRGYQVLALDFVPLALNAARKKAADAKVKIEFLEADLTKALNLGGPFDGIYDRGVYHSVRTLDLKMLLQNLEHATRTGTRWLSIAGNARQKLEYGPPVVTEEQFRAELGGLFTFVNIKESTFTTTKAEFTPLSWVLLMERK